MQITKAAIKNYQIGRRIPHCGFDLQLMSDKSSEGQLLRHEVAVTGVSTLTTFHMRYPQTEGEGTQRGSVCDISLHHKSAHTYGVAS